MKVVASKRKSVRPEAGPVEMVVHDAPSHGHAAESAAAAAADLAAILADTGHQH